MHSEIVLVHVGKYQKWLQANKPMFAAQTVLIIFCAPVCAKTMQQKCRIIKPF